MCGIAGIYAYHYAATEVDRNELLTIRDAMWSRGPDDSGEWYSRDNRVGLGHRRLAVIDPGEGGHQPMAALGGSSVITYNGEIYNFRELREELRQLGHRFHTRSDTEVLLGLYWQKGERMVEDLRGMFAFAIWDNENKVIFLARDPYGIKPLYYSDDGWHFRFASQVGALTSGGRVSTHVDPAAEASFLLFGSIVEPHTRYSAVRALPAGSTMWVSDIGAHSPRRYCAIADFWSNEGAAAMDDGEVEARARQHFSESVSYHMVSDVPVGTFLSAGIDSGSLTGLMSEQAGQSLSSVTLAFDEFRGRPEDESVYARQVANLYGTSHLERRVGRDEFDADLPGILAAMDQPTIDGINTWFTSKAAAELGIKVMVSGLGGDELLGGYPSFDELPLWVRRLKWMGAIPGLGDLVRQIMVRLPADANSPKAAGLVKYGGQLGGAYLLKRGLFMPWELASLMGRQRAAEGLRRLNPVAMITQHMAVDEPLSDFAAVSILESCMYMRNQLLRDTDWASMAHGVEVRVPLVDIRLLRQMAPLLAGGRKGSAKHLLAAAPRLELPPEVIGRGKTGFTTPIADWVQHSGLLGHWKEKPQLSHPQCHWSRRYAYAIHRLMFPVSS